MKSISKETFYSCSTIMISHEGEEGTEIVDFRDEAKFEVQVGKLFSKYLVSTC